MIKRFLKYKKTLLVLLFLLVPSQAVFASHNWSSDYEKFSYHSGNTNIIYSQHFGENSKHFWFYNVNYNDDSFLHSNSWLKYLLPQFMQFFGSSDSPFDYDHFVYVTKYEFNYSATGQDRYALKVQRGNPKKAELWKYQDRSAAALGGRGWRKLKDFAINGKGFEPEKKITTGNIGGRIIFENGEILQNGGWKPEDWKSAYKDATVNLYPAGEAWGNGNEIQQMSIRGFNYDNPPGDENHYLGIALKDLKAGGLYPGKYRLQHYWKNSVVECQGGTNDLAAGVNRWCSLTVKGTVSFSLGKNGEITIDSRNADEKISAKNVDEIKIDNDGKTTDPKKGINLVMKAEVNSPINEALGNAIKWLIETLNKIVDYLTGWVKAVLDKANNFEDMQPAWKLVRDISLSLLTLGIIVIAFANVLNLDIEKYGAQRIIPKLVIGVILTYFSFIIARIFVEAADVLTAQFRETLSGIKEANNGELYKMSIDLNNLDANEIVSQVATILFMAVLIIGVIIALIYLTLLLLLRIVIINFLVVVAPVAFILGIMPFTESLSKRWWGTFSQWVFMGPAVMGMLLIGNIIINATFGAPGALSPSANESGDLAYLDGTLAVATAAVAYFLAAQIPMMMAGEAKAALSAWSNKVKGGMNFAKDKALIAPVKGIDNKVGISRAWKGWRSEVGKRHDEQGEALLHSLSGGKYGTSRELIERRRRDNEVKRHMDNIGDNVGLKELQKGAHDNTGALSEAYLRKLAQKDLLEKGDLEKLYKECGESRGDNVLMENRTKHGSWEAEIREAKRKAGITRDNPIFGSKFIMERTTHGQIKDLHADEFGHESIKYAQISQKSEMKQQQLNKIFTGDKDTEINEQQLGALRSYAQNLRDAKTAEAKATAIRTIKEDSTFNKNAKLLTDEQLFNVITGRY